MSELNDIKIDNEEYWWDELDNFVVDDEIVVMNINKNDLINNNLDGLTEIGSVEMGAWDALSEILNEKEGELHKMDFEADDLLFLVLLYSDGQYVTSIQGDK